ncbi:MAG: hypothetical protein KAY37_01050 [Phycisphaerae bacterium]|nr:hypothetical protein [Phycisphaerae bacterium]
MALPIITERAPQSPARTDERGPIYSRVWEIVASSEQDAYNILYVQAGVKRGAVYTNHQGTSPDSHVVCQVVSARGHPSAPVGGTGLYEVTAEYGYSVIRYSTQQALPYGGPKYRMERTLVSELADLDVNGDPIVNSADEPIDPPLTALRIHRVLVIEWIIEAVDWETAYARYDDYEGLVNSSTYKGQPPKSLFCEEIDVADASTPKPLEVTGELFRVTARFAYLRPKEIYGQPVAGWEDAVVDKGRREKGALDADNKRLYPPILMDGVPVDEPVLLDGAGRRLANTAQKVYRIWEHYETIDFNNLGV